MRAGAHARVRWAAALAGALLAGAGMARGKLERLPPDRILRQGEGSPAPVIFSHGSHVDPARPGCVTCHPRTFRILGPGKAAAGATILHESMESGAACGACHGRTAFGFESCEACHKGG
jgi:c(7)-type cytochrome triheme protein